jgi:5-methylthioribose kinase
MADQYEFLTKDNISKYLSSKKVFANLIDANNLVEFKEVGDGNLNLVFIMKDSAGKRHSFETSFAICALSWT